MLVNRSTQIAGQTWISRERYEKESEHHRFYGCKQANNVVLSYLGRHVAKNRHSWNLEVDHQSTELHARKCADMQKDALQLSKLQFAKRIST